MGVTRTVARRRGAHTESRLPPEVAATLALHRMRDPGRTSLYVSFSSCRRIKRDSLDPKELNLVDLTKLTEKVISDDLEDIISKTVDKNIADYAVITGVHIHSWAAADEQGAPNLEFIQPRKVRRQQGRGGWGLGVCPAARGPDVVRSRGWPGCPPVLGPTGLEQPPFRPAPLPCPLYHRVVLRGDRWRQDQDRPVPDPANDAASDPDPCKRGPEPPAPGPARGLEETRRPPPRFD